MNYREQFEKEYNLTIIEPLTAKEMSKSAIDHQRKKDYEYTRYLESKLNMVTDGYNLLKRKWDDLQLEKQVR